MTYRMHMVLIPEGMGKWKNANGDTECVELVRQTTGAPETAKWRPGQRVRGAPLGLIAPYTAIATFVDGRYPTDGQGRHAALYLSHNETEIRVVDQWNAQGGALPRSIRFDNKHSKSRSNEGNFFYVVERG